MQRIIPNYPAESKWSKHMIGSTLVNWVRDKLKWVHIVIFTFVVVIWEFVLNQYENYPHFYILLPMLLLIMTSTILALKLLLSQINSIQNVILNIAYPEMKTLYTYYIPDKSDSVIILAYIFFELVYFVCMYRLQCFSFNLMGLSILFFGGITFLFALIGYEIYVRITMLIIKYYIYIKNNNISNSIQDVYKPKWLIELYKLSKRLIAFAMVLGFLFILANDFILVANAFDNQVLKPLDFFNAKQILSHVPNARPEFYSIWTIVFFFIAIMFPVLALVQNYYLKLIVEKMHLDYEAHLQINSDQNDLIIISQKIKLARNVKASLQDVIHVRLFEKFGTITIAILSLIVQIISTFGTSLHLFK